MSFSACGAIDEVRVKGALFVIRKLAVKISGQPGVDFVVNRGHLSNPLKPERAEAPCAWTRARAPKFRAVRR